MTDFNQQYESYMENCNTVLSDLNGSASRICRARKRAKIKGNKNAAYAKWWNKIYLCLLDIYNAEIDLIEGLSDWVKRGKEDGSLNIELFTKCEEIIGVTDLEAQFQKDIFPRYFGKHPLARESKPALRALLWEHWIVYRQLKRETVLPDYLLGDCIDMLHNSLEKLKWLRGVFICYSHDDTELLNEFFEAIDDPLEKDEYISVWYDYHPRKGLKTSDIWFDRIIKEIDASDLAIVLVSKKFMESKFIKDEELFRFLEKRKEEGMKIFPIILDDVKWKEHAWLNVTQFAPTGGETINTNYDTKEKRNSFYKGVVIKDLIDSMNELSILDDI